MIDNGVISRPETAATNKAAVHGLADQLAAERKANRLLQKQLSAELEHARRAAEEAVKARAEREQYRRVLAAAVANEKSAQRTADVTGSVLAKCEADLQRAVFEKGEALGRVRELEERLRAIAIADYEAQKEANDRDFAQVEREAEARAGMARSLGVAEGRALELRRVLDGTPPDSSRLYALRSRASFAGAVVALALGFLCLPALALELMGGERATYLELVTNLSAWQLVGATAACLGLALALLSQAIRDRRVVEQTTLGSLAADSGH